MDTIYNLISGILFLLTIALSYFSNNDNENIYFEEQKESINNQIIPPNYFIYLPQKDTVYTYSDRYIEICLKKQIAKLVRRNDSAITYHISTGNPNIKKGQATPPGIYTVQSKSPIAVSKQFNDAKLYNWIGFDGNVGFHGLDGKGYYYNLGKRPSSHGCVRISREDGEKLYKLVQKGTPVFVYNEKPARILTFADSLDSANNDRNHYFIRNNKYLNKYMTERMKYLLSANSYINFKERVILDGKTVLNQGGIDIGLSKDIPVNQKNPIYFSHYFPNEIDNMTYNYNIIFQKSKDNNKKENTDSIKQNSKKTTSIKKKK